MNLRKFFAQRMTLIEILIILAIVAVGSCIMTPNFLEVNPRSPVSRAKADLRSIVIGLESYFVDNNAYPPADSVQPFLSELEAGPNVARQIAESGVFGVAAVPHLITTPVSYLVSVHRDIFSIKAANPYGYYQHDKFYVIYSAGPDSVYNIQTSAFDGLATPQIVEKLTAEITYDLTNGTDSSGDIWRSSGF